MYKYLCKCSCGVFFCFIIKDVDLFVAVATGAFLDCAL